MDFTNLKPWDPPDLQVSYFTAEDPSEFIHVAGVAFSGNYPPGSLGNGHGRWISRKTIDAYLAFDPITLVLDFRGMHYTWGNTLMKVFQDWSEMCGEIPPLYIVVSDLCTDAIRSLLGSSMDDLIFDSLTLAMEAAEKAAKAWLD